MHHAATRKYVLKRPTTDTENKILLSTAVTTEVEDYVDFSFTVHPFKKHQIWDFYKCSKFQGLKSLSNMKFAFKCSSVYLACPLFL